MGAVIIHTKQLDYYQPFRSLCSWLWIDGVVWHKSLNYYIESIFSVSDYPDYSGTYYNNFPMKDEEERAKNGTKYEEEEEEANNEIDY